jgi:hypothetical protein
LQFGASHFDGTIIGDRNRAQRTGNDQACKHAHGSSP